MQCTQIYFLCCVSIWVHTLYLLPWCVLISGWSKVEHFFGLLLKLSWYDSSSSLAHIFILATYKGSSPLAGPTWPRSLTMGLPSSMRMPGVTSTTPRTTPSPSQVFWLEVTNLITAASQLLCLIVIHWLFKGAKNETGSIRKFLINTFWGFEFSFSIQNWSRPQTFRQ